MLLRPWLGPIIAKDDHRSSRTLPHGCGVGLSPVTVTTQVVVLDFVCAVLQRSQSSLETLDNRPLSVCEDFGRLASSPREKSARCPGCLLEGHRAEQSAPSLVLQCYSANAESSGEPYTKAFPHQALPRASTEGTAEKHLCFCNHNYKLATVTMSKLRPAAGERRNHRPC